MAKSLKPETRDLEPETHTEILKPYTLNSTTLSPKLNNHKPLNSKTLSPKHSKRLTAKLAWREARPQMAVTATSWASSGEPLSRCCLNSLKDSLKGGYIRFRD